MEAIVRAMNCRVTVFLHPLMKEVGAQYLLYQHLVPVGQDTRYMGLQVELWESRAWASSFPWPKIVDCY